MTCTVAPQAELVDDDEVAENAAKIDGLVVEGQVRVVAALTGIEYAERLTFLVDCPDCFLCTQNSFFFTKMQGSTPGSDRPATPLVLNLNFKVLGTVLCSALNARISCTWRGGRVLCCGRYLREDNVLDTTNSISSFILCGRYHLDIRSLHGFIRAISTRRFICVSCSQMRCLTLCPHHDDRSSSSICKTNHRHSL